MALVLAIVGMTSGALAEGKKFKRALVIAGGGITPGIGLGIIAGAREQGWEPDVIITTCGAALAAAIENAYHNSPDSLKFAKSVKFFDALSLVKLETKNAIKLRGVLSAYENLDLVPPVFDPRTVLSVDQNLTGFLPASRFDTPQVGPRVVIVAAKAQFSASDMGVKKKLLNRDLFRQVYFTDPDTALSLKGLPSRVRTLFPQSYVATETEVITDKTAEQAIRASISDPMLINPGKIDDDFYMTGAVDLFPIETAHLLADEVMSTYPARLYKEYEDTLIESTFGFKQTQRALHAIQDNTVKWIDVSGIDDVSFDPVTKLISIKSGIPDSLDDFANGIQKQYEFGRSRVIEAIQGQKVSINRQHLRLPINPALLQSFTCKNANEWSTPEKDSCTKDVNFCDRNQATKCTPIR